MLRSTYSEMECGHCDIDKDSTIPASRQMFKHSIKIFSEREAIVRPILNIFYVALDRGSFCCKEHTSVQDLLEDYISLRNYDGNTEEDIVLGDDDGGDERNETDKDITNEALHT